MRTDLLKKYIWIIDTITSHGKITRRELNRLWRESSIGDGADIPHRTFFNYRRDIEHLFNIDIVCTSNHYHIPQTESYSDEAFRSWLLDAFTLRGTIADTPGIAHRIVVEKIPSARRHLSPILAAINRRNSINITYAGYTRSTPQSDIIFNPHFVKLFRQRWYVIGEKADTRQIRTYALDRIVSLNLTLLPFDFNPEIDPQTFFNDCFGITYSQAPVNDIRLSTSPATAKYLRALPLHPTQQEQQYSDHSIFTLRLKITDDLIREIAAHGPDITVISPPQLRTAIITRTLLTLKNYLPLSQQQLNYIQQ